PLYLGAFAAPSDFGRTLHISGVRVFASTTTKVTITPRLCRGGSFGVTTTPASFCSALTGTAGVSRHPGDTVVLAVESATPGTIFLDRVRIAYRDGWRWATQDAGAPSEVTVLAG